MSDVALRAAMIRQIIQSQHEIDLNLPKWARRSHPIVRRHLGMYWRVMTPQFESMLNWFLPQAVIILLTLPIPFLLTLILPMVIVSVGVLPAGLIYYAKSLYHIATDSSRSMVSEIENSTLSLLLATPYTPREILLCKIAGAIWRQSEMLTMFMGVIVASQMPTIVLVYLNRFPVEDFGIIAQIFMIGAFAVSIVRVPLEMFLISTIGNYIGTTIPGRSAAMITTLTLMLFYFVLINMPRLLVLPVAFQFVVDIVLPVAVPLGLIFFLLRLTEREFTNKI